MTLPRANRRLTLRTATVLLALVALAILLVGTPTASADDPPQAPDDDRVYTWSDGERTFQVQVVPGETPPGDKDPYAASLSR